MGDWNSTSQAAWYVRHAHWAHVCYISFVIWCLWTKTSVWSLTFSYTSFTAGRSRVFYIYSSRKDTGRWLPWVRPGSTERFYKDVVVRNHSAHGYYNPHRWRGNICMILLHVKQNQTKLRKNCHAYNTIIRYGYISNERQFEWWDELNQRTIMWKQNKNWDFVLFYRYVVLPLNVAAGHSRGPAQAWGSG